MEVYVCRANMSTFSEGNGAKIELPSLQTNKHRTALSEKGKAAFTQELEGRRKQSTQSTCHWTHEMGCFCVVTLLTGSFIQF